MTGADIGDSSTSVIATSSSPQSFERTLHNQELEREGSQQQDLTRPADANSGAQQRQVGRMSLFMPWTLSATLRITLTLPSFRQPECSSAGRRQS